jgi:hypothetical protein
VAPQKMTIDSVPCALCDERVHLDGPHVRLTLEYRATEDRYKDFVAHVECVDEFDEPEP